MHARACARAPMPLCCDANMHRCVGVHAYVSTLPPRHSLKHHSSVCRGFQTFDGLRSSSLILFSVSTSMMLLCACGYVVLRRLAFVKYQLESESIRSGDAEHRADLISDIAHRTPHKTYSEGDAERRPDRRQILKKILPYGIIVLVNFLISLSVFPSVVTDLHSHLFNQKQQDWFGVPPLHFRPPTRAA